MPQPSFGKVFEERLRVIEAEAAACGLNLTDVCRLAGISRATPDRWKREHPNTVRLIERIEAVIEKQKKAMEKAAAAKK